MGESVGENTERVATAETVSESADFQSDTFFQDYVEAPTEIAFDEVTTTETIHEQTVEDFLKPSPQENLEAKAEIDVQKLIDELEAYFGGQKFQYKTYTGTVTDIVNQCPYAEFKLKKGFDAFVDWIEPHKYIENPEESENTNNDEVETAPSEDLVAKQDTQPAQKTETTVAFESSRHEKAEKIEKLEKVEKPEKSGKSELQQASVKSEPVAQEQKASEAPVVSLAETPALNTVEQKEEPAEKAIEVVIAPVEVVKEALIEPTITREPEAAAAIAIETLAAKPAKELVHEEQSDIVSETPEVSELDHAPELSVEQQPEILETYIEEAVSDDVAFEEPSVLERSIISAEEAEVAETHLDVADEIEESEEVFENEVSEIAEDVFEEVSNVAAKEIAEEIIQENVEYFEEWQEIAQEEAPLDIAFITMTEGLDAKQGEVELEYAEGLLAAPNEVLNEEFDEIELPSDADETNSQQKLRTLLVAVQTSKQAVEKMYSAKSKEECATYIDELTTELIVVLRALGYENPEKIIRDFLYSHSPESLNNLIQELEFALRRTLNRQARQLRAHHVQNRHARLGKFVGYIMQALSFKKPPLGEAEYT